MINNRGAILPLTLCFALGFTMVGLAIFQMTGTSNRYAMAQTTNTQALWLANAGIEEAKANVPPTIIPQTFTRSNFSYPLPGGNTAAGNYSVTLQSYPGFTYRWKAISTGTVAGVSRRVEAVISKFNVLNAVTATGTFDDECIPSGSGVINGSCQQKLPFTFETVFGLTYSNDQAGNIVITNGTTNFSISHNYTDNPSGPMTQYKNAVYDGISVITSSNGGLTGNKISGSGLLIIDCTNAGTATCIKYVSNDVFNGVVWIIGNVEFNGTPNINGALFIQSPTNTASGNSEITFNEGIVNDIFSIIPSNPTIVEWKEVIIP